MRAANRPVDDSPVVQILQCFESVAHDDADQKFAHAVRLAQVAGGAEITERGETPERGPVQKGSDEWQQVVVAERAAQQDSGHLVLHVRVAGLLQVQDLRRQSRAAEQDAEDAGRDGKRGGRGSRRDWQEQPWNGWHATRAAAVPQHCARRRARPVTARREQVPLNSKSRDKSSDGYAGSQP